MAAAQREPLPSGRRRKGKAKGRPLRETHAGGPGSEVEGGEGVKPGTPSEALCLQTLSAHDAPLARWCLRNLRGCSWCKEGSPLEAMAKSTTLQPRRDGGAPRFAHKRKRWEPPQESSAPARARSRAARTLAQNKPAAIDRRARAA